MLLLRAIILFFTACLASAAVVPESQHHGDMALAQVDTDYHQLMKRDPCANGLVPFLQVPGTSMMLCLRLGTIKIGYIAAIAWIGKQTVVAAAQAIVDMVKGKTTGTKTINKGRRRGVEEGDGTLFLEVRGTDMEVPFVHDAAGKLVINLLDVFSPNTPTLAERALSEDSEVTITGGTATYHPNGTLDTFTFDFSFPISSYNFTSDPTYEPSALAKRGFWTLHTTYWAQPGHGSTSLDNDHLTQLVQASYYKVEAPVSEVCGYMANSGTWHGAFRHWTGDNGYSIGECEDARKF